VRTIFIAALCLSAHGQTIEVEDIDGGPGLPELSNIKLNWNAGQLSHVEADVAHMKAMPAGIRIGITIKHKEGSAKHTHVCGTYITQELRALPKTASVKMPASLDEDYPAGLCEPGEVLFDGFESVDTLVKEAAERRAEQLADARREAAAVRRRQEVAAACGLVYQRTSAKRIVDLTVNDADEIQACKVLGLYRLAPVKPALAPRAKPPSKTI
jgi:hypothetical protein